MAQLGQNHFLFGGAFGLFNFLLQLFCGKYAKVVFVLGLMLHFFATLVVVAASMMWWEQWTVLRAKGKSLMSGSDSKVFLGSVVGALLADFISVWMLDASVLYGLGMYTLYFFGLLLLDPKYNEPVRNIFFKKNVDTWAA